MALSREDSQLVLFHRGFLYRKDEKRQDQREKLIVLFEYFCIFEHPLEGGQNVTGDNLILELTIIENFNSKSLGECEERKKERERER